MQMKGLAQSLFSEREGCSPWKTPTKTHRWPQLYEFVQEGILSSVDLAFAQEMLTSEAASDDEEVAAFLCYLLHSARHGHLCVEVNDCEDGDGDGDVLSHMIQEGVKKLPPHLVTQVDENSTTPPSTPLCQYRSFFYLQRFWLQESRILAHFHRIAQATPPYNTLQLTNTHDLLPEQAEAIRYALSHTLTIISGGPGTGKTYTAGLLIKILCDALPPEKTLQIALAAPTGKAAANLERSLRKAFAFGDSLPESITAKTLHALLNVNVRSQISPLTADVILVDESSMIDSNLMERLVSSVKSGARLILLGDRDQLPPIASGNLFADLTGDQIVFPSIKLNKCLRTDSQSLLAFARHVNAGDGEEAVKQLATWHSIDSSSDLIKKAIKAFSYEEAALNAPLHLLEQFHAFRILSPLREGPWGVNTLNRQLLEHFTRDKCDKIALPILITANDYRLNLFNGETGILICQRHTQTHLQAHLQAGDYALFPSTGSRPIPAMFLPKFEYAYCLSVHKSQGSEFDYVALALPEGSEVFGREVLYTAITRAKKTLDVYTSKEILLETIGVHSKRLSGLRCRLK